MSEHFSMFNLLTGFGGGAIDERGACLKMCLKPTNRCFLTTLFDLNPSISLGLRCLGNGVLLISCTINLLSVSRCL